jgi:hypothetical protein
LNDAGTTTLATTLGSCPYTSNAANSRIDLTIGASGSCTTEFAAYPTSTGSVLLLELDSAAVASGTAYAQSGTAALAGAVAIGLGSQGIFYNTSAQYGIDLDAALNLRATATASAGSIDINNFNAVYPKDPVNTATTAIAAPSSLGRGTMTLSGQSPNVTFGLVYYVVSPNLSLLLGSDATRTNIGQIGLQY